MKIGILTSHDSINYGALLQAYCMAQVYRTMGHEAKLIDKRRSQNNTPLRLSNPHTPLADSLCPDGVNQEVMRQNETIQFLRQHIGLTDYHFNQWEKAPSDLGFDLISVGSGQVWNPHFNNPFDYLPGPIPTHIPTIAYAASMEPTPIPEPYLSKFLTGLSQFKALSVRENTVMFFLHHLGVKSVHTADPVILAGRPVIDSLTGPVPQTERLCLYFGPEMTMSMNALVTCLKNSSIECDCFSSGPLFAAATGARAPQEIISRALFFDTWEKTPNIHFNLAAGLISFLRSLIGARAVITNSYHALVLSALYHKNVRFILSPKERANPGNLTRIQDILGRLILGKFVIQPSIESALHSLQTGELPRFNDAEILRHQTFSRQWLQEALQ